MEIQVTNLGAATSTYLWLHDVNMPFTLTPSFVVPLTLATGATSAPISINVSYPIGSPLPAELCSWRHSITLIPVVMIPRCIVSLYRPAVHDNLVVTADTSAGCCATVNLTNGYNGSFFSGRYRGSTAISRREHSIAHGRSSYTGTWSAYGTASAMYVQPTGGFVPMGSIPGLLMCA